MNGTDLIAGNLAALEEEAALLEERRAAHLYELARVLAAEHGTLAACLGSDTFCAECRRLLGGQESDASRIGLQLSFCSLLLSRYPAVSLSTLLSAQPPTDRAQVAYVGNPYADRAFRALSARLRAPKARTLENYTEVCDAIAGGDAAYGILPLESAAEGILLPFRRMIDQYELKIAAATAVGSSDGSQRTLFVLLSSRLTVLDAGNGAAVPYLELTLPALPHGTVGSVLLAAEACRLSTERVHAIPLSYDDRAFTTDLLFDTADGDQAAFLTWLSLFCPAAVPIGLYSLSR